MNRHAPLGKMTKGELIEALSGYADDDIIVVEVHDTVLHEDLYDFTIDVVEGLQMMDGSVIREIRICPVQHQLS